ncbi:folate-binding protein [Chitinivorax sp. PXF-14]|uniref:CAF17-like 4Fe-4S cluster assembly/insertion protein YgfZ n=1 Tax=Chitinivorax sp. PXF-14 TaxID=3230488 RepID=UPI00346762C8
MHDSWRAFLATRQATFSDDAVLHFGNQHAELHAARQDTVLADLSHHGLIRFTGEETSLFLNNLLSSDVKKLGVNQAQWSSFSTPKGRMLANFLIWCDNEAYLLQLPKPLQAAIQKKLSMYVLRSKTKPADASADTILLGLAGTHAATLIERHIGPAPAAPMDTAHHNGVTVIRLSAQRFELAVPVEQAATIWEKLAEDAKPVGQAVWSWLEVQDGTPWILPATQEQFVPQMANMELIGAVSFSKGCYPGQEIVARTQYLGKLKRRMYLMHVAVDEVSPGQELYSAEMNGQASGMIANVAPAPGGGFDVLAVVQIASLEHDLHLGSLEGPVLIRKTLPYAVH